MSITPGEEIRNNYILSLVPEQELEFLRTHFEGGSLNRAMKQYILRDDDET